MRSVSRQAKSRNSSGLAQLALCLLWLAGWSGTALAHSPHDDIFNVASAVGDKGEIRLFVTVRGNLLVSDDEGQSWQRALHGLDHGHQLFAVAAAPSNPRVVYVGSLGEGGFRSLDGGDTWSRLGASLPANYIQRWIISPRDADTVAALSSMGRVFLSRDGGDTWNEPPGLDEIADQVAFDLQGRELVAALSSGKLVSWPLSGSLATPTRIADRLRGRVMSLAPVPGDEPGWILGLDNGELLQVAAGDPEPRVLWQAPGGEVVRAAIVAPTGQAWDLLAVAERDGPWCRSSAGGNWSRCGDGLTTHAQAHELGRPYFSNLHALARPNGALELLLAGYDGLFRTGAPGSGWDHVKTLGLNLVMGLGAATHADGRDSVYVTTYLWGAFESSDGGDSWRSINFGARDYRRTVGFTRLFNIHPVVMSGDSPVLFTSTWYRWLRKVAGARRWTQSVFVDDPDWLATHHGMTAAFSPDFSADGLVLVMSHHGVVLRSTDQGNSFERIASLPEQVNQATIANSGDGGRVVFAAGTGTLFRSLDGGLGWEPVLDLGTLNHSAALTGRGSILHEIGGAEWLDQIVSNDVRASAGWVEASPDFARDGTVFAGGVRGLFRSTDGGMSFTRLTLGEADGIIDGLALSPAFAADGTVLVAVRGKGLLVSRDKGESFVATGSSLGGRKVQLANYHSYPIPISPPVRFSPDFARNNTVYGLEGPDIWRSTDGGETWAVSWSPEPDTRMLWYLRLLDVQGTLNSQWRALKHSRKRQVAAALAVFVMLLAGWGLRSARRARRAAV